jgi:preprotein translocase subunit YajC|tara:strand:- start:4039 stop:4929 length:891 start_codon:yes stop_codon:yes gene_type:complete
MLYPCDDCGEVFERRDIIPNSTRRRSKFCLRCRDSRKTKHLTKKERLIMMNVYNMEMKNKIFMILAVVFMFAILTGLLPSVNAESEVYQQDTVVDLKVPCLNNNTYCSGSATCNITIMDSADTVLINNQLMQNQGAYHNYTLNLTLTSNSGEFSRNVICIDNNLLGYGSDTYIITPTGSAFDDPSSFSSAIVLVLMFGVTIFFLIFSKATINPGIQLFFNLIGYLTMALTVGAGVILLQNAGVQSNLSTLMSGMMWIVGLVLVIIMYYIFIQQTRRALALMKAKKGYGNITDDDDF